MSLNNIQLPASLLAALYPSSLVETGLPEAVASPPPVGPAIEKTPGQPVTGPAWKYLGHNQGNILIIVNHTGVLHLPDEELSFLTSILTACKLSLGDVAIVNKNNHPQYSYRDYLGQFNSKVILLFGVDPAGFGLPVDFPSFQVQSFTGSTFLYSPPLDECHDKLIKSKLWVSLKRIFNL